MVHATPSEPQTSHEVPVKPVETQTGDEVAAKSHVSHVTTNQVRLRTNKRHQQVVVAVVVFGVFIDVMGTVIVMPALASLCSYAENGPVDSILAVTEEEAQFLGFPSREVFRNASIERSISPHAFRGERGAWAGSPPFGFSFSMNFILSAGQLGSAFGSLLFNRLCDVIGAKIPMQICLLSGIVGYLIIYAAGVWVHSYYLFAIGMFWNNFFGNTVGVASTYFGQLFTGDERDMYVGLVQGMLMIGASIGAFIVMPFANSPENGENFFNCIWLAIGLTALAFLLVSVVMVPPEKKKQVSRPSSHEVKQSDSEPEPAEPTTPKLARKLLLITIVASALDSAGDEGTRMARGTILSNLFPEWSTTARQNYLLLAMIVVAIFAASLIALLRSKVGITLPVLAVFGCVCTLATQLFLAFIEFEAAAYIAVWHIGKLFGFISTFCSEFLIQAIAPQALLGYWNGRNEALSNLAAAITPLIFARVYDDVGNPRGKEMLLCTSAVSLLATLAYCPLIKLMPKKQADKKMELESLEHYENMSDEQWSKLPLEITDSVAMQMMEAGKAPRYATWGEYSKERPMLGNIHERALTDFKYLSKEMLKTLVDRELMLKEQQTFKMYQDMVQKPDRELAKHQMGAWIADYLDDAGYINWETQTQVYKAMLLTALPPIDDLQGEKPDFATMEISKWEDVLSKFLAVMDNHLATSQRQIKPAFSMDTMLNTIRRR